MESIIRQTIRDYKTKTKTKGSDNANDNDNDNDNNTNNEIIIDVDASASHLGDDVGTLLDTIISISTCDGDADGDGDADADETGVETGIETESSSSQTLLVLSFEARMNKLTTKGASNLFDRIISAGEIRAHVGSMDDEHDRGHDHEREQVAVAVATKQKNETEDDVTDVDVDLGANENNESGEKSQEAGDADTETETDADANSSLFPRHAILMKTLDIGLNHIGRDKGEGDDNGDDNGNGAANANILELRAKMMALLESGCCPNELRMDFCGLDRSLCRAIGKVRCYVERVTFLYVRRVMK